jgi:hypothetical protein
MAEIGNSLDQFASARQQSWGDREAKRCGGFEVNEQLKFCRCLHRQVAEFRTFEDAVDVPCRRPDSDCD